MATISTRRKIRISLRSAGLSMTAAEFDALPARAWNRNDRYELIRRVLVVTPPAGTSELDPNEELEYSLRSYKENHPQGRVIDKTIFEQTLFTTANRRRCDRAIWIGLGRIPNLQLEFSGDHRRIWLRFPPRFSP